ncbi:pannexin-1 [Parus major]|uniref:pannexin-1 n=1 Tax=Parus major TaxID=9157 RepID=UPI0007711F60|nr:pannexin-1 [Parus major]
MAIAHIATEYVFSDFLLKEPPDTRYKGLRLELALDKIVTCIVVGLPLLLISLAFAQEVSTGAQISCFAPSSFSWRQAAYVDSYCWAAVQQKQPSHNNLENIPLWLHKFFPYILLLVAILLYLPCLFWRFTAAPHLSSDLKFIMEELDKAYNRAIKAANSIRSGDPRDPADLIPAANENLTQSLWEISESYFKYPIVEQYLKTKKNSKCLIIKYIMCRLLTLVITFVACLYLGYYISLSSLSDEFLCTIKTGILKNDTTVPEVVQCKLITVGVFKVLSYINLIVYLMVMPLVVYAMFVPWRWNSGILKVYEILPTFDVLKLKSNHFDDLSLYLLFLEENVSELKSFKCLKVLENIAVSEKFDVMQLLVNLGTIKTDTIDGKPGTAELEKPEETATEELGKDATELQVLTERDASGSVNTREDKRLRQRLIDSSC